MLKGGIFWEGGIDSGRVEYICLKGWCFLGGRGGFWERRIYSS